MTNDRRRITLTLDTNLFRQVKIAAATHDITMTRILEDAVRSRFSDEGYKGFSESQTFAQVPPIKEF